MRFDLRTVTAACALLIASAGASLSAEVKIHRVAIQVDQNDPAIMNLALNNASNIMETFKEKGEEVEIELVTYGPGLNMLREDTSPVKDRLKQIAELSFPAK
ncbi:MAG: hypothetical protein E6501_10890, partial [Bradyrhizobium sp.]|nr:hypothetical protein [Bradyrhizobium sp.]